MIALHCSASRSLGGTTADVWLELKSAKSTFESFCTRPAVVSFASNSDLVLECSAAMANYGVQTQVVVEDDVMEYEPAPATSWRGPAPSLKAHNFAMIRDGPRPSRGISLEGARAGAMAQPVGCLSDSRLAFALGGL